MRRFASVGLPALAAWVVFAAEPRAGIAPVYSQATIVPAGSEEAGPLAPNSLVILYGENLSSATISRAGASAAGALMPTGLPGAGVTVKVNGLLAGLEYASPEAIVFVVPPELVPGTARIVVTRNSLNGPTVQVQLVDAAPTLLPLASGWALARRAGSGEWCLPDQGARPGEEILLYGTGWGAVRTPLPNLLIPDRPNELKARSSVRVLLEGIELEPERILYAGLVPGAPGLYQLRLRLPEWSPRDPEIRISVAGRLTRPGLRVAVSPASQLPADPVRTTQ